MEPTPDDSRSPQAPPTLFAPRSTRDELPVNGWALGGLVALLVIAAFLVLGRHHAAPPLNSILPLDPAARSVELSQLAMSESTSLSGGKSTFIDGHVRNVGSSTISGITVQVLFLNNEAMPPFVVTTPLSLIRTHEPYVDTMPVDSAPLKAGDDREFRLIFETIPSNWNMQTPEIHVVHLTSR